MSDNLTVFEARLAARLTAYSEIDVPPVDPLDLAGEVMSTPGGLGLRDAWLALRRPVRVVLVAAIVMALLAGTLVVGSRLLFPASTVFLPRPTDSPAPSAIAAGPAAPELRSRWLTNVTTIPGIDNGSGPVTLTIDATGSVVSLANLAPGASFASTASVAGDTLQLALVEAAAGCEPGASGEYQETESGDRSRLTLVAITDACQTRSEALARTWERTLVGPTTVGAGLVDTMEPNFWIRLPDAKYEARTLDDFIEVTNPDTGNGFDAFKNPQGFADSCSAKQVRYPYKPGAAAFVAYFRQNDAFIVVSATPLTIDGHDAIHLVLAPRVSGARCPGADLWAWTPKACDCHFFSGDDNLYLVDVGADTFMFELPLATDPSADLPIIQSIRIPYTPGELSP
jgi:hypothetical protein